MVRAVCVAVALLLAVSPVDAKSKATFPALSKKNPVCTFGVDQVRVKGTPTDEATPVWWKKSIPCKGPQGYAIQQCQLKSCQCRKFHTHVEGTDVTTWAECLPKIKDKAECVGADMRWCDNYLRGKDPLSKGTADKKAEKLAAAEKADHGNSSDSADETTTKSAAAGGAAAPVKAANFPVLAVVLASVGVLLAVIVGTWLVTSKKKKTKKTAVITAPDTKDPQSLEFDDFDDDDHHHKDLYTDAQSTAAAVHTVAEPPIRRMSSASVSSVSSSDDDDDDDDDEADKNQDSWIEYSKK
ncbi:hypothetical protein AC1031_012101 [Aphanomyces cochlioides]|nr:hypothetical protein AC1031_012101 [Aphanomyces cochlioides]